MDKKRMEKYKNQMIRFSGGSQTVLYSLEFAFQNGIDKEKKDRLNSIIIEVKKGEKKYF